MTFQLWHLFLLASASLLGLLFVLVLAEPGLPYDIDDRLPSPEDHEFMGLLAKVSGSREQHFTQDVHQQMDHMNIQEPHNQGKY